MDLRKHIIDTIKEWQLKIGYREGNMKLYYPGESLEVLLNLSENGGEESLAQALATFCDETESELGRIKITGSFERYCLDIPAKGCAYVAEKSPEPEFLKLFLQTITDPNSSMKRVRECFASYAAVHGCDYIDEEIEENHTHSHNGHALFFADEAVEEYVYWVEENEFGLTYHRFTREDYEKLK